MAYHLDWYAIRAVQRRMLPVPRAPRRWERGRILRLVKRALAS